MWNKVVTNLMILAHYDIDRGDVAVQYMLKNAVVGNSGASTDNAVCVSQWQSEIPCVSDRRNISQVNATGLSSFLASFRHMSNARGMYSIREVSC